MRMRLLISMWLGCAMVGMVWAASSPSVADEAVSVLASIEISTGQPEPGPLRLVGSRDRRQLIATAVSAAAHDLDVTAAVSWRVEPETLAVIEPGGMLIPLADGEGRVIAAAAGAGEVAVPLIVERVGNDPPIDFISQIVPVFTKYGCNGGGCHGKSGGQNGFRLSLLGFEPAEDHEHLVKEARGRRISLVAPETSLLLAKAAAEVPHGGGKLIEAGSPAYQLLADWIREGARPSGAEPPRVSRIEVFPTERTLLPGQRQQLRVMAFFDDGRIEDVTRMAQYEVNAPDLAEVAVDGLVTATDPGDGPARCGTVAVMVRYQSQVGVFRGTTPLDTPPELVPSAGSFARTFLDEKVLAHLRKLGLPPSPVCDDATFLRRVTIDIAGRLPTTHETEAFLADSEADKRDRLIDRLLDSEDYAHNFATKWSAILRNKRANNELHRHGSYAFYDWIRESIAENKPYSEFVRDIITATGEPGANPAVIWYRQVSDINQQVEDASQLFLGQRLQCARCHHHPFEKWGTDDYFELAAFFSRIGRKKGLQPGEDRLFHNRGVASAKGPKGTHKAAVLGTEPAELPIDTDPRQELADWMVAADNPFFAKSLVNRYWKHFFAVGLVEPEDDMRVTNPATNPELLDAMAAAFVEHGYDMKWLIREICRSTTYQLSAVPNEFNAQDRQSYSRFFARRLPAEIALDAIDVLTGSQTSFAGVLPGTRAVKLPDPNFDNYFLTVFGRPNADSACECERGSEANLAQSLHLINSADILGKLSGSRATRLSEDAETPVADKIDQIYMVALSRHPSPDETAEIEAYLAERADRAKEAWEDVVWSLLNTKEFLFNH